MGRRVEYVALSMLMAEEHPDVTEVTNLCAALGVDASKLLALHAEGLSFGDIMTNRNEEIRMSG
jgi:hypothetical protein